MPFSIRNLEATEEELVAAFIPWYERYQEIIRQDEGNQPWQEHDINPPAESVIPALLNDYSERIHERAAFDRARRERFESLAQRHEGKELVYREGNMTLFIATLLRASINGRRVEVTLRICFIDGLPFLPPMPVCDLSADGVLTVSGDWSAFYFDELRWYEPYVDWSVFLDDAVVERVKAEAKFLANTSPKERFAKLNAMLIEQVPEGGWPIRPI